MNAAALWCAGILILVGIACWRGSDLTNQHWQGVLRAGLICFWVAAIILLVTFLPQIQPCCRPV